MDLIPLSTKSETGILSTSHNSPEEVHESEAHEPHQEVAAGASCVYHSASFGERVPPVLRASARKQLVQTWMLSRSESGTELHDKHRQPTEDHTFCPETEVL